MPSKESHKTLFQNTTLKIQLNFEFWFVHHEHVLLPYTSDNWSLISSIESNAWSKRAFKYSQSVFLISHCMKNAFRLKSKQSKSSLIEISDASIFDTFPDRIVIVLFLSIITFSQAKITNFWVTQTNRCERIHFRRVFIWAFFSIPDTLCEKWFYASFWLIVCIQSQSCLFCVAIYFFVQIIFRIFFLHFHLIWLKIFCSCFVADFFLVLLRIFFSFDWEFFFLFTWGFFFLEFVFLKFLQIFELIHVLF